MDYRQERSATTTNPTVYNRLKRRDDLSCSYCPPNRSENKKTHKKHGVRKPRRKIRDRRTWIDLEDWK